MGISFVWYDKDGNQCARAISIDREHLLRRTEGELDGYDLRLLEVYDTF